MRYFARILAVVLLAAPPTCAFAEGFDASVEKARAAKKPTEKIRLYEEAVYAWTAEDGRDGLVHAHAAMAAQYRLLDDHGGAVKAYSKTIELERDNPIHYRDRAQVFMKKQDFPAAIDDLAEAIRLKPDDPALYYDRGRSLFDDFKAAEALQDYEKALALIAEGMGTPVLTGWIYSNMGFAHINLSENEKALGVFNEALSLVPDHAEALSGRGLVLGRMGRVQEAYEDFKKALDLDSELAKIYHVRAIFLKEQNNFAPALSDCDKAILLEPNAKTFSLRAGIHMTLGDYLNAKKDLAKAIELAPDHKEFRDIMEEWEGTAPGSDASDGPPWGMIILVLVAGGGVLVAARRFRARIQKTLGLEPRPKKPVERGAGGGRVERADLPPNLARLLEQGFYEGALEVLRTLDPLPSTLAQLYFKLNAVAQKRPKGQAPSPNYKLIERLEVAAKLSELGLCAEGVAVLQSLDALAACRIEKSYAVADIYVKADMEERFVQKEAKDQTDAFLSSYAQAFEMHDKSSVARRLLEKMSGFGAEEYPLWFTLRQKEGTIGGIDPEKVPAEYHPSLALSMVEGGENEKVLAILNGIPRDKWTKQEYGVGLRAYHGLDRFDEATELFDRLRGELGLRDAADLHYFFATFCEAKGEKARARKIYEELVDAFKEYRDAPSRLSRL